MRETLTPSSTAAAEATPNAVGRPPRQRQKVAKLLRDRIWSDDWKPGERLAPRRQLIRELGVSTTSLQAAMDQLHREGFIQNRAGRGTFVTERPPHLYQHALILPAGGHRFYKMLEAEAVARSEADHRYRFKVYRIDPREDGRGEQFRALRSDIRHRLVAGLIISVHPSPGQRLILRLAESSNLPVTLHGSRQDSSTLPIVRGDMQDVCRQGIAHLRERGRTRIALLCEEGWYERFGDFYDSEFAASGLPVDPLRVQHVDSAQPRSTRQLVRLLFRGHPGDRPDGLIVTDARITGTITAALAESGLAIGRDLDAVLVANFPLEADAGSEPGFACLGYDVRCFFAAFLDQLDAQSENSADTTRSPGQVVLIPPRFARPEDWPATGSDPTPPDCPGVVVQHDSL